MIPLTHCKNQKIFVLGLGLSGDSAIRALEAGGADGGRKVGHWKAGEEGWR